MGEVRYFVDTGPHCGCERCRGDSSDETCRTCGQLPHRGYSASPKHTPVSCVNYLLAKLERMEHALQVIATGHPDAGQIARREIGPHPDSDGWIDGTGDAR